MSKAISHNLFTMSKLKEARAWVSKLLSRAQEVVYVVRRDNICIEVIHGVRLTKEKASELLGDDAPELIPIENIDDFDAVVPLVKASTRSVMAKAKLPKDPKELEGKFSTSTAKLLERLNELLTSEYTAWLTYTHFGFILKGPYRDQIKKIFDEHAEQELEHANKLAMRIVALGGVPTTTLDRVPVPKNVSVKDLLVVLVKQEQEALFLYRDTLRMCGDNEGLKQNIETIIEDEQEHSDELGLLQPSLEEKGEVVAKFILSHLARLGTPSLPLSRLRAKALTKFAKSLERVADSKTSVTILDENPKRIVYDISSLAGEHPVSICRVVKENDGGEGVWTETCESGGHVDVVKTWESEGRKPQPWEDVGVSSKEMFDSLRAKGKKPFHKNVSHKPLPKLTKPENVKRPLQKGKDVEPRFVREDEL